MVKNSSICALQTFHVNLQYCEMLWQGQIHLESTVYWNHFPFLGVLWCNIIILNALRIPKVKKSISLCLSRGWQTFSKGLIVNILRFVNHKIILCHILNFIIAAWKQSYTICKQIAWLGFNKTMDTEIWILWFSCLSWLFSFWFLKSWKNVKHILRPWTLQKLVVACMWSKGYSLPTPW